MAFDSILKDTTGKNGLPQYFNLTGTPQPLKGDKAPYSQIVDASGNPLFSSGNPANIKLVNGSAVLGINADGSVNTMTAGFTTDVSIEVIATTTEESIAFNVSYIMYIVNDGSDDIFIKFSTDTTQNFIRIRTGEGLDNFPRKAQTLYYRANSGSQAIRALGVK